MSRSHHSVGAVARARNLRRGMTLPEKLLWIELRKLKLNIRRQAPIGRYVADFVCHSASLVIEIDGARHDLPEDQLHDLERTAWLNSQGYRVIRFRNEHVIADAVDVANQIRVAIAPPKARLDGDSCLATAPTGALAPTTVVSPPTPALPPSRGKGE